MGSSKLWRELSGLSALCALDSAASRRSKKRRRASCSTSAPQKAALWRLRRSHAYTQINVYMHEPSLKPSRIAAGRSMLSQDAARVQRRKLRGSLRRRLVTTARRTRAAGCHRVDSTMPLCRPCIHVGCRCVSMGFGALRQCRGIPGGLFFLVLLEPLLEPELGTRAIR